ncbi:MAG TPA: Na+/H+ antiporter subunit D [Clostridia bacterium]|nr:Na+/H+ antiporter subunit D [Clostridia bacterium]
MKVLLVLPVLIPLMTAGVSLLAFRSRRTQRWLGLAGTSGLLAASVLLLFWVWRDGIQAIQMGNWVAPFGITLVADLFSAIMVALAGIIGFAVAVYSLTSLREARESFHYYPLVNILLTGVCGAFLTGDIFNLYVWFEVMLIASFVLLALGGERDQMRGALKYVAINLISSALFLSALGILYGLTGTLNMADLALRLERKEAPGLLLAVSMLLLVAFGVKAAIFPLFFWLPASYHTPPVAVSALFAGLLTKVGVYALIRVFTLLFLQDTGYTHRIILVLAGFTMLTGVMGAMVQNEFRRILSFHIISQIGYMILGLGLFTLGGLAGSIFYIVHHIIVKTNLFLVSGVAHRLQGSFKLEHLGGLYLNYPALAILFLIPALSLAGVPPLSGFFAKLSLVEAGLAEDHFVIVTIALVVGLMTLYSMTKIWTEAFWKPAPASTSSGAMRHRHPTSLGYLGGEVAPIAGLAALTILIGLGVGPLMTLSTQAAGQLLNRSAYIHAVLENRK